MLSWIDVSFLSKITLMHSQYMPHTTALGYRDIFAENPHVLDAWQEHLGMYRALSDRLRRLIEEALDRGEPYQQLINQR